MSSLRNILKEIGEELQEKDKVHEKTMKDVRKIGVSSKQAILLIHQKRFKEAEKLIERARKIISEIKELSTDYPEVIYSGSFSAARQEFSEANIFLKSIKESRFVTPDEINVPSVDYVLGLADVIGEYRRLALDALREGNGKKGEQCLQTMDEIYIELTALDEAYMLVPGLRRKCDVARKLIEITRGDITQEVRRSMLEKHLERFERQAKRKK